MAGVLPFKANLNVDTPFRASIVQFNLPTIQPMMQALHYTANVAVHYRAKHSESKSLQRQTNASDQQEISTNLQVKGHLRMVMLMPTAAMHHGFFVQLTS